MSTTEGGSMAKTSYQPKQSQARSTKAQPKAKKLPDLRNEKTYQKLLRVADSEVRASRRLRFSRAIRLLGN